MTNTAKAVFAFYHCARCEDKTMRVLNNDTVMPPDVYCALCWEDGFITETDLVKIGYWTDDDKTS